MVGKKSKADKTNAGEIKVKKASEVDRVPLSDKNAREVEEVPLSMMKHPLNSQWCFWMFTNEKKSWEENLVKLTTFDTVEDYWCLYHYMKKPSELKLGQDYAVFKNNIRPMWEDSANKKGGRLLINMEKKRSLNLDTMWMYVVLFLIGENFPHSDLVCGAVVNVRAKNKIGLWLSDASKERANFEICQILKDKLGLNTRINFHAHNSVVNMFTV